MYHSKKRKKGKVQGEKQKNNLYNFILNIFPFFLTDD